ncbi:MAG: TonB-dependent receptor [Nitrospirota bacterium]|nr:TonB-dependent receptor [Nitrospirota bacterium]
MPGNTGLNHHRIPILSFIAAIFFYSIITSSPAFAQPPAVLPGEQEELLLYFSKDEIIATATKQAMPLSKVPAVATVITAEQIRNMGARTLFETLKIVPGLGIFQDYSHDRGIEIRGVKTLNSEKVLVLLDGMRLNQFVFGGAFPIYSDLPLDNVKRIEVIRGPVSALYGANAFTGVINVITKEGGEINGVDMRAEGGSFSTQRYNILAGKKFGDLEVAAHFNYLERDGDRRRIEQDLTGASGRTDNWRQRLDTGLTASWKGLRLDYRHTALQNGPYIGATSTLNDESHHHHIDDIAQLSYRYEVTKELDASARIYWRNMRSDQYWELFPEGFMAGTYPDGVLGNPRIKERTYGAEVQVDYKLFKDNLLTVGVNIDRVKQYDVQHWANFDPDNVFAGPLAGGFQNITDWKNWNQNAHRNVFAWYLQDSWNITSKLNLIAGVRRDEYSDFGNTTNPRVGLVWQVLKNTHVKLLAGKAFRAPSGEELYNEHNPSAIGNQDLKPERITTTELAIETKVGEATIKASYFKNYISNTIERLPIGGGSYQHMNSSRRRIAGLELEGKYHFNKTDNAYANFTWLELKRLGSGEDVADVPKWRSNIGGNVAFARYFNFNTNIYFSGERPRTVRDTRKDLPSYAVIDAALTFKNFWKGLEIQLLAKNLLDKRYDDPAAWSTQTNSVSVPGDYPREGREIFLEARYTF